MAPNRGATGDATSVAADPAALHPQTLPRDERRGVVAPARTMGGNGRDGDASSTTSTGARK